MRTFLHNNRKSLLALCYSGVSLFLLYGMVDWGFRKYGEQYDSDKWAWRFADWVSDVYMPAQRRATKKWPVDLTGLPRYTSSQAESNIGQYLGSNILRCYHERFIKFQMVKSNRQVCTYRLCLKDRTFECDSGVSPQGDSGSCRQVAMR